MPAREEANLPNNRVKEHGLALQSVVIYDNDVFSKGKQAITEIAASSQCFQPALPLSGAVTRLQLHLGSDPGASQYPVMFPHLAAATKPQSASGRSARTEEEEELQSCGNEMSCQPETVNHRFCQQA